MPPVFASDPVVLTLPDCLALGRERSITMLNTRRERRIADESIRGIRAQVYPSLDSAASYTRLDDPFGYPGIAVPDNRDQYSASLTAEQLLYAGGSVRAALRAAQSYQRQADEEVSRVDAQLVRDISRAFYLVLFREAEVAVGRESVEQLSKFEAEARLKHESGAISEFEWLSAQVSLANERPRLVAAENEYDIARSSLRNLLYLEDDHWTLAPDWKDPLQPSPSGVENTWHPVESKLAATDWKSDHFNPDQLHALQDLGRENRWELSQARMNLDVLEADIKVTEGDFLPEVKAFATYRGTDPPEYKPTEDGWDWHWVAGVRATWKWLDGGARSSTRIEKQLRKEMAADVITDLERQVMLEIETAYRNIRQAIRVLDGALNTIQLAEKALNISRLRFDRGLATNLEFTDRNLELNRARIQYSSGLLVYHNALADLNYACGITPDQPMPRSAP